MIPLLCAAALMDTVLVLDEFEAVTIHEWGVITVSEEALDVTGYPYQETIYDPELDDRAPVVNFYGMEFRDAEFTVTLNSGQFTDFHPIPDGMDDTGRIATWNIVRGLDMGNALIQEELIPGTEASWEWDMDDWRNGYNHVLEFSDGSRDRFIYYECSLPLSQGSPLPPFSSSGGLLPEYQGQILAFSREGGDGLRMALCRQSEMPANSQDMELYDRDRVLTILCSWADGSAKSHELEDLWNSWEDYVIGDEWESDRLLVFRIPDSSMETVSTLNLTTSEGYEVLVERFYLGMVPFSWLD